MYPQRTRIFATVRLILVLGCSVYLFACLSISEHTYLAGMSMIEPPGMTEQDVWPCTHMTPCHPLAEQDVWLGEGFIRFEPRRLLAAGRLGAPLGGPLLE